MRYVLLLLIAIIGIVGVAAAIVSFTDAMIERSLLIPNVRSKQLDATRGFSPGGQGGFKGPFGDPSQLQEVV